MKNGLAMLILGLASTSIASPPGVGERDVDGALIVSVGGSTVPQSFRYRSVTRTRTAAQLHAKREANLMASRLRIGHFLGCAPGARFCGVGMGPNRNCSTCTPRFKMALIADEATQGRNGYWYRSRHWK